MLQSDLGVWFIELLILSVVFDVFLSWVQTDVDHWPRRFTHLLTLPIRHPVRKVLDRLPVHGWDFSPLVIVAVLTVLRVWLIR